MVATVQSENYNFFSRRIGYAIGGFNVISRISEIGSIYSKNKKFDLAVWNEIIHNWEVSTTVDRNKPSDKETSTADHTANFYYYLDVFRKDERIITPLSTLETLGTMANAMDHEKYLIAAKLFIFSKIIENDGDYYANLLLSNFDSKEFYKKIEANFEHKQQILLKYFKNYNVQKNVKDALSMRVQGNFKDEEVIYKKKLENIEIEELKNYDQFIFLAGVSNDPMADFNPEFNFASNSVVPSVLAYKCKKAGIKRFIYSSSCSIYGNCNDNFIDEDYPKKANFSYGISKYQGEIGVNNLNDENFSTISLRLGTLSRDLAKRPNNACIIWCKSIILNSHGLSNKFNGLRTWEI